MEPRRSRWLAMQAQSADPQPLSKDQAERMAQVMAEGKDADFWTHLKQEIESLLRHAEMQFLDTMAKDYESYVQWWARRAAYLAVLNMPERFIETTGGGPHAA